MNAGDVVLRLAALVGAGAVLWGALAVVVRFWRTHVLPVLTSSEKIDAIHARVEEVARELRTNGGTSLKDAIDRIDIRTIMIEQRERALHMDGSVGVFETDASGSLTYCNRTLLRWAERSMDEMLGAGWHLCIFHDDREAVIHEWNETVRLCRQFAMQYRIVSSSGKVLGVRGSAYPLIDRSGTLYGYLGSVSREGSASAP